MKRNMQKTVEAIKGKNIIPSHYDMDSSEISTLFKMISNNDSEEIFNAIQIAFDYGFVMGARAQKAGKISRNI